MSMITKTNSSEVLSIKWKKIQLDEPYSLISGPEWESHTTLPQKKKKRKCYLFHHLLWAHHQMQGWYHPFSELYVHPKEDWFCSQVPQSFQGAFESGFEVEYFQ